MSDTMKRITLSVMVNVAVEVDADLVGDEVHVVSVCNVRGLPSVQDIMESLDHHGDLQALDDAYVAAGGELP